jgi:multidrug resistance efflux pump
VNLEPLPPIPSTPGVLWGQFRHRVIPTTVFLGLFVLAVMLWSRVNNTPSFAGIAEGVRSSVTTPQPCLVLEVKVRPYQLVNKGDIIAVVNPIDPRMPLELLQAELQVARMRHEPSPAERNAMDYQRVRVELLRLKSELAVARVNLKRAENELQRNRLLFRDKLLSEDMYDLSVQTREALQAEVTQKDTSARDLEQRLEDLRGLGDPGSATANLDLDRLLTRLEKAHALATTNWGPLTLVAPISGMIAPVLRQPGEYVLAGQPLAGIESLWSDRVVAYLRQPYAIEPEIGKEVLLTTRSPAREQFSISITHIGAQVEVITNALAFVRQGTLVDVGLPVVMDLPPTSRIRPGELVDLRMDRTAPDARAIQITKPSL